MASTLPTKTKWHGTNPQTGISISRDGKSFTVSWKQPYNSKDVKWQTLSVTGFYGDGSSFEIREHKKYAVDKTSYTFNLDPNNFYPSSGKKTLKSIVVYLMNCRKDYKETYSKTVTTGSGKNKKKVKKTGKIEHRFIQSMTNIQMFSFSTAKLTSISKENGSGIYQTIFSWVSPNDDSGSNWHRKAQVQSKMFANCSEGNGAKLDWNNCTNEIKNLDDSKTITETSAIVATGSHTRWLRARVLGVAGANETWKYSKRVFAEPYQATITSVKSTANGTGYMGEIKWKNTINNEHPAEFADVQYVMVTPEANMECPAGASWQDAVTVNASNGSHIATFAMAQQLEIEQVLYYRVVMRHDLYTKYGVAELVRAGYLKDPEVTDIDPNDSTHKADITIENTSSVPDAKVAIYYKQSNKPKDTPIVAVIPAGETTAYGVQCPNWGSNSYTFGAMAFVGSEKKTDRSDGVSVYTISPSMQSKDISWYDTTIPRPPSNVTAEQVEGMTGTVKVTWDWAWIDANIAEVGWADHKDAWESTDEPETYEINNTNANSINVSSLSTGMTWYFRVRLIRETADGRVAGGWSLPIVECNLASAPQRPVLILSKGTVTQDDYVVANWAFVSTDGTAQAYAELCEATITGQGITYSQPLVTTQSAQSVELLTNALGWQNGSTHYLAVRTTSGSGQASPWSEPVAINVAMPLECEITATSLVEETQTWTDSETGETTEVTVESLKEMPLSVTVSGAGTGGNVTVALERAENYRMERPDEKEDDGFEGELIAKVDRVGDGEVTIDNDMLYGKLDDGAKYKIIATVRDSAGQSATAVKDFEVHWAHQAIMPSATVEYDDDHFVAKITPEKPEGAVEGDTFDIYRLSCDQPEKIVEHGDWDTVYVDPFPAIDTNGAHRIVFVSKDGDYITEDNGIAMYDTAGEYFEENCILIDFDNKQLKLEANIDYSNSWAKDFKETKYLGGSVQGDWNKGVSRTGSAATLALRIRDMDIILLLKDLAVWEGECHVRTPDGSSFTANVDVSETNAKFNEVASYTLSFTRVDGSTLDGMTEAEWEERQNELEQGL